MDRFTANPISVEASQWKGNTLNLSPQFNAVVLRYAPGGEALIRTEHGTATLRLGDWLVCDRDGVIAPMRNALFEVMFSPAAPPAKPETLTLKRKLA